MCYFRRWAEQGAWDAILATLVELGLNDDWQHMIDRTIVRGHVSVVSEKGGLLRRLLLDHVAASSARSTAAMTIRGGPLGFVLTDKPPIMAWSMP